MSIHLVGGGWSPLGTHGVYDEFLVEATARAAADGRTVPLIGVLLVAADDEVGDEHESLYRAALVDVAPCEPVVARLTEGGAFALDVLSDIDALLVAGGLTPAYLAAVSPLVDRIRDLVAGGMPYLGFSAGAAIASEFAIVGGWLIDGVAVCPEVAGEQLDEVTVVEGLGLVDLAVEAHAAQWGTLTRLIAATEAGLVDGGVAIDEFTVAIVRDDDLRVEGIGNVWRVLVGDTGGVVVSTLGE